MEREVVEPWLMDDLACFELDSEAIEGFRLGEGEAE
jgi:hypothetical protein